MTSKDMASGSFLADVFVHLRNHAIAYAFVLIAFSYIKPYFFSPLSKYPGPPLARCSNLWKLRCDYFRKRHLIYLEAHKKYGPVFRDGPNSLSFCSGDAVKKIYGRGKDSFPRSDGFQAPGINKDHPPVFFAMTAAEHTRSRRKVGGAYTMSSILTMENQIDEIFRLFEQRLDEEAQKGKPFDLSVWVNYFTVDIISDLAYGEAFGFLRTGQDVNGIIAGAQGGGIFIAILGIYSWVGKLLFKSPVSRFLKLPEDSGLGLTMKIANDLVEERYRHGSEKRDLVSAFMAAKDPDGEPISKDQVRGEIVATLVAGGDTTANSIVGIIGMLLKNPAAMQKLRAEIDEADAAGQLDKDIPRFSEVSKLPYLDAVISEGLRLSPSVGGSFTRLVPTGGAEIDGFQIPGGVEVGVNNWVMGRYSSMYGVDAEVFRPERWLDLEDKKRFKDYEFGFGHGARICIGKNLAHVELYKAVCDMVRKFEYKVMNPSRMWKEEQKLFLYKTDFMVTISKRQH